MIGSDILDLLNIIANNLQQFFDEYIYDFYVDFDFALGLIAEMAGNIILMKIY